MTKKKKIFPTRTTLDPEPGTMDALAKVMYTYKFGNRKTFAEGILNKLAKHPDRDCLLGKIFEGAGE